MEHLNEKEKLIEEIVKIANDISLKNNLTHMELDDASDDVKKWVYGIADFILADRKKSFSRWLNTQNYILIAIILHLKLLMKP